MANVYATKTGNWSDTTVWNTGALPTSSDDVYANTYTVTIDQDVTVLSLSNKSATSITAGGSFTCSTARTITASGTGIVSHNIASLTLSHTSGTTVTLVANIAGNSTGANNTGTVALTSTGTTNVTGNVAITIAGYSCGIYVTGGHTLNLTGNVSVSNGTEGTGYNRGIWSVAASTISVTGSVTGLTLSGGSTNSHGLLVAGGGTITITGSVTAGINSPAIRANSSGTATLTIVGTLTANTTQPAVLVGTDTLVATGPFLSSASGYLPIISSGPVKLSAITNNEFRFKDATSGTASLWSSDVNTGAPTAANVRYGTRFGTSNEFTGTCQVPAAASVLYGVPVDNTTGTASLTSDPQLTPL